MSTFWQDQRRRVNARYRGGSLDQLTDSSYSRDHGMARQRMGERILNRRPDASRPLGQIRAIKALLKSGRLPMGTRALALRRSRPLAQGALLAADDGANQATMAWLAAVAPSLAAVIESHWIPVAQRAVDFFPVDTGLARDSMTLSLLQSSSGLRIMISNPVAYMHYIRWAQKRPEGLMATRRAQALGIRVGRSPWWDLVRHPVRDAAMAMSSELAAELERRSGGAR